MRIKNRGTYSTAFFAQSNLRSECTTNSQPSQSVNPNGVCVRFLDAVGARHLERKSKNASPILSTVYHIPLPNTSRNLVSTGASKRINGNLFCVGVGS
jgi:hypothetical protein